MFRYLVSVAYDGSDFAGWAKQPKEFTVQGYIEKTLSKTFQTEITILASSRTDKGVHALDQKFTFSLTFLLPLKKIQTILQKALQDFILVKKVQKVANSFHPLKNVISKEYRYFISTNSYDIFGKKYCWEYNNPLQVSKLNNILKIFQGQHDFFNFAYCRQRNKAKTLTIRTIDYIKAKKEKELVVIKIKSHGFLRYQIRTIIGEVINCYQGKQIIKDLQTKLTNFSQLNYKYRSIAPTAGLYLWKIKYR